MKTTMPFFFGVNLEVTHHHFFLYSIGHAGPGWIDYGRGLYNSMDAKRCTSLGVTLDEENPEY